MFKAVIFDLDGTLIDTIEDIAAAVNSALAVRGFPARDNADFRLMVGNGMRNLIRAAVPAAADEGTVDACAADATRRYGEAPARYSRPYSGVVRLLEELRSRGVPTGILSNKPDALTALCVEAIFPGHDFRAVQGERAGVPRKPDPAAALAMAAGLGALPREVLYLGDSDVDMRTAGAAGFFAAGAAWGFRGRAELEAAGADAIIEKPLDLLDLFDNRAN